MCIFKLEALNLLNGYTAAHRDVYIVYNTLLYIFIVGIYSCFDHDGVLYMLINSVCYQLCIMKQHLTS